MPVDFKKKNEQSFGKAALMLPNILVLILYVVTGYLGLKLALPPGYATAIFPPAGIALGFILLFGPRILPGVFLGSLTLNSILTFGVNHAPIGKLPLPVLIAIGATLQTYFAFKLFKRYLGQGNNLDNERSVLLFILLIGAIACVVNATWSVASLTFFGEVPAADALKNWLMWWVGDAMGAITVAPVLIALQNDPLWRPRRWTIVLPSLAMFAGIVTLYLWASSSLEDKRALEVKSTLSDTAALLRQRITAYEDAVTFGARFLENSAAISDASFQAFLKDMSKTLPGMKVIAWAPAVFDKHGTNYTAKIEFLAPLAGNEKAFGFDLASEPTRREMLDQALALGTATASRGIPLVQEGEQTKDQLSILMAAPVKMSAAPDGKIRGFVSAAIRLHDIFSAMENSPAAARKRFRIVDISPGGGQLYPPLSHDSNLDDVAASTLLNDAPSETFVIGGRKWELGINPSARNPDLSAWSLLFFGLLSTALLEAFLLVMTGKTALVNSLVTTRTLELSKTNAELSRTNAELEQFAYIASHDLQTPVRHVATYGQILDEELGPSLTTEHREALGVIIYSAKRMRTMLDDLLLFTSLGNSNMNPSSVNLNEIINEIISFLHADIQKKQALITLAPLPSVFCDREMITHVLRNLIHNAIRYTREETAPYVHISAEVHQGEVHVCVRDKGIGIPADQRERIFKIFQRLSKPKSAGTGIGLAICKKIIERHRSHIWVESTPGQGSSFYFSLPLAGGHPHAAA